MRETYLVTDVSKYFVGLGMHEKVLVPPHLHLNLLVNM